MAKRILSMIINSQAVGPVEVPDDLMMIDFLHEHLNLTGSRLGCGQGVCHACVAILDKADGTSEEVRTCITGVHFFDGKRVRTIEGHAKRDAQGEVSELNPIQQKFVDKFAFQCSYCTPATSTRPPCWWKNCSVSRSNAASWKARSKTPWASISAAAPATCATTAPRAMWWSHSAWSRRDEHARICVGSLAAAHGLCGG